LINSNNRAKNVDGQHKPGHPPANCQLAAAEAFPAAKIRQRVSST